MADKRHARKRYRRYAQCACELRVGAGIQASDSEYECGSKQHSVDKHAHVVRHVAHIDKEKVEPLSHLHKTRDKTIENCSDNDTRHTQGYQRAGGVGSFTLPVVVDKTEGRYTEQVEQVNRNRHTYNIGYKHKIAVAVRLVCTGFPFKHQPHHKSRAERRERIDLALDGREPESIAPRIGKCAANAAPHNKGKLPEWYLSRIVRHDKPLHKMRHRPEKQQYGCRAQ